MRHLIVEVKPAHVAETDKQLADIDAALPGMIRDAGLPADVFAAVDAEDYASRPVYIDEVFGV